MHRKVIIDTINEYKDLSYGVHVIGYNAFLNELNRVQNEEKFTIVFHFDPNDRREYSEILNLICFLIYNVESIFLVIEEIHLLTSTRSDLPRYLMQIATTGAHKEIGYLFTSQRPSYVNKTLIAMCDYYFIGLLLDSADRDYFRDSLGESRKSLASLQNYQFVFYDTILNEKTIIQF